MSEALSIRVTFTMASHSQYLPVVRAAVGELAAVAGCDEAESRALVMAVDEALANVIRHAYHGRCDGQIELECLSADGSLRFRLRDNGDAPAPGSICARDLSCDQIGGLGTHVIREVMDSFSYQTAPDGNWFTATKQIRRHT